MNRSWGRAHREGSSLDELLDLVHSPACIEDPEDDFVNGHAPGVDALKEHIDEVGDGDEGED